MKKHHNGNTPEYLSSKVCNKSCNWHSSLHLTSNAVKDSFYNKVQNLNTCTKDEKTKFHPCHRLRKLALKHMLKTNKMADLSQRYNDNLSTTTEELETELEQELKKNIECK